MKKIFAFILGALIAIPAISQTTELVEIIKRWPNRIDVNVTHGLVHKRLVSDQNDSAFYFHANGKQFIATTNFHEIGLPPIDPPPVPLYDTIDNAPSQQIVYGGTWAYAGVNGHYKNTISFSATTNSFIEFTNVTGKEINLFFERKSTHGMAEIILNGVAQVPLIDLYTSTQPELKKQLLYNATLRPGPNTIRIRVTGAKNPASTFQWVVFDFATLLK